MYTIRPYRPGDVPDCAQCFYEGFFNCPISENDLAFMMDYVQVLIEKSNFTYVAESEGHVVGFVCGTWKNEFSPEMAKQLDNARHYGLWCKFTLKYLLRRYGFSREFAAAFRLFFAKMGEIKKLKLGRCDCELVALCSRKEYRKGLGTALLGAFTNRCSKAGAVSIRLFTNSDSTYTFYEKRGFHLTDEKPYAIGGDTGKSMVFELLL